MRLNKLDSGHTIGKKLMLTAMSLFARAKVPDSAKTLFYRPEFFGGPHSKLQQAVMRGDSFWTVGERELMAAFISERNRCRFCTTVHRNLAETAGVADIVEAALRDPESANVRPELKATLAFLDKLTTTPDKVVPADVAAVRSAGVDDDALLDAIHVCFLFCLMNRVMDAFGAEAPTSRQLEFLSKILLGRGYEVS
jgi:uncharacterized peroxidase-related enzyme